MEEFQKCSTASIGSIKPPTTALQQVENRIAQITGRIGTLTGKAAKHSDTLFGCVPHAVSGSENKVGNGGIFSMLSDLEEAVSLLEDAMGRFDG